MIILADTNDKLQVASSVANSLDVTCSFVDKDGTTFTPGKQWTNLATATTVDIVAAPTGSAVRNVKELRVSNKGATATVVTIIANDNGTQFEVYEETLPAGRTLEYLEGVGFRVTTTTAIPTDLLLKVLSADNAGGQNVATAQPWFPTAGAVTVAANSLYEIDGFLAITRSAGTTSHTTGLLFAGTATVSSIQYICRAKSGDVETNAAMNATVVRTTANTTVKAASTSATEAASFNIEGFVRIGAGGTFIPQFIYSVAPGGAPTVRANSYFMMKRHGSDALTELGTWA